MTALSGLIVLDGESRFSPDIQMKTKELKTVQEKGAKHYECIKPRSITIHKSDFKTLR